jgi:four helix bundle protein
MTIAEACGGNSARDTANCLQMAMGSACEMEYGLLLGNSLGFLPVER